MNAPASPLSHRKCAKPHSSHTAAHIARNTGHPTYLLLRTHSSRTRARRLDRTRSENQPARPSGNTTQTLKCALVSAANVNATMAIFTNRCCMIAEHLSEPSPRRSCSSVELCDPPNSHIFFALYFRRLDSAVKVMFTSLQIADHLQIPTASSSNRPPQIPTASSSNRPPSPPPNLWWSW